MLDGQIAPGKELAGLGVQEVVFALPNVSAERKKELYDLYSKQGYNELWSRLGRRCVKLTGVTARDVVLICEANGVDDERAVDAIVADSEGDLRRVVRRVHAWHRSRGNAELRRKEVSHG